MVVSDRLHQNAGCAEQPLVLGLKIDRKASQLPRVEETTHSDDTLGAHEVGPFNDTGQRRVRRPRPVCCQLAAPSRPEVEVRVQYPLVTSAISLTLALTRGRFDRRFVADFREESVSELSIASTKARLLWQSDNKVTD